MKNVCRVLALAGAAVATAVPSFAAVDWSGATTSITAEISPAVTAALPIFGAIAAVGIAFKIYKRFAK